MSGTNGVAVLVGPDCPIYAATGISNASGNVIFTFPVSFFAVVPVLAIGVETGLTDTTAARITAKSAAACTVNVRRRSSWMNFSPLSVRKKKKNYCLPMMVVGRASRCIVS